MTKKELLEHILSLQDALILVKDSIEDTKESLEVVQDAMCNLYEMIESGDTNEDP